MEENSATTIDGATGRVRSGAARMAKLTPVERTALATKAARRRWAEIRKGEIYEPDAMGDLPIVGHTIPCAVIITRRLSRPAGVGKGIG